MQGDVLELIAMQHPKQWRDANQYRVPLHVALRSLPINKEKEPERYACSEKIRKQIFGEH